MAGLIETYAILYDITEEKAYCLSIEATITFRLAREIRIEIDQEILKSLR
jgi:hypothetical protein